MKSYSHKLTTLILAVIFIFPPLCQAQLWPHIKTFGFDYGYPRDTTELQWLATHHDVVIGAGDWQTKKISEDQYDTMKAANQNVIIIPYVVIQAFTFQPMEDFMMAWVAQNADKGYKEENLYLHYYSDTVVKTRIKVTKTSGTGTPSDRVCDINGTLLTDGLTSNYYISLGYGGGTAQTIEDSRIYQYWNAGFEPRMNHLSQAWKEAYKAYILDVMTSGPNKYNDGVMLDTYQGVFDTEGYLPNMNTLIEVRDAGYGANDTEARLWYSEQIALYIGVLREFLKTATGKSSIYIIPNFGELSYTYDKYKWGCEDQFATNKIDAGTIEYTHSPSKSYYFTQDYFKKHYEVMETAPVSFYNHLDSAWFNWGGTPPLGGKQFMIGALYLFNHPGAFSAIHYGSSAKYGPEPTFADSHWDKMIEYDIGTPLLRAGEDFWGISNTDRVYLVEHEAPGLWNAVLGRNDPRGRFVLARDYTKALVVVRFERSNNNTADELGTEPREYSLGGNFRRLLEDNSLGPLISKITLGLAEGAILIRETELTQLPSPNWKGVTVIQN